MITHQSAEELDTLNTYVHHIEIKMKTLVDKQEGINIMNVYRKLVRAKMLMLSVTRESQKTQVKTVLLCAYRKLTF